MSEAIRTLYVSVKVEDDATKPLENIDKTADSTAGSMSSLKSFAQGAFGAAVIGGITSFASASLDAYKALEQNRIQAQNLAGPQGYEKLQEAINETIAAGKGIADEGGLLEASNQALKLGASFEFVSQNMQGLQQLSKITGGDITQIMGQAQDAINTGRIGFLKNNAIFADYIDDFKAIGTGFDDITKKRREMLITNILQERANDLQSQYNNYAGSLAGLQDRVSTGYDNLKESIGEVVAEGMKPLLAVLAPVLEYFTDTEDGAKRVKVALMFLAPVIGIVMVAALAAMAAAAWTALEPFLIIAAPIIAVTAALAAWFLIIEDIYTFAEGGDSVFGDFLQWIGLSPEQIKFAQKIIKAIFDHLKGQALLAKGIFVGFVQFLFSIPNAIGQMIDKLKEFGSGIIDFLLAPIRLAFEGLQQIPGFDKLMAAVGNFGGARAAGGPVSSGSTYLVGEQGPELFTPSRNGSISPNGSGISIGSLVGSLVLNVSGSAEAGAAARSAVIDALNELARGDLRAQMGLGL